MDTSSRGTCCYFDVLLDGRAMLSIYDVLCRLAARTPQTC